MADRTRALLAILFVLCVASAAHADETSAKEAESRAFTAVDEQRWCDAVFAFLSANDEAPSVDLIYNAALAADEAQDYKRALKLYVELLGAYPDSDRGAGVQSRITELTQVVRKEGEGTRCVDPAPAPAPAVVQTPPEAPAPAADEDAAGAATPMLAWGVAGAGGALVVLGGVIAGVGVLPYADFVDAREQILAAEAQGADAALLQQRQGAARQAWATWGELSVWTGVTTSVVGVAVAAVGVGWALLAGGEE